MNWLCKIWIHKWGKWGILKTNECDQGYQIRHCEKCNNANVRWT